MMHTIEIILAAAAVLLLVPSAVFFIECVAALLPAKKKMRQAEAVDDVPAVILIPAHNEEDFIVDTIRSLKTELTANARLAVIADNCTDATAELSRNEGVSVIERNDTSKLGKIHGLDYAIRQLADDLPRVLIVIDADCRLAPGGIRRLIEGVVRFNAPVQAKYLLAAPGESGVCGTISSFAFLVKNHVRSRGLARLGLPCMLAGSGMAFPFDAIATAPVANTNMAKDYQLCINLALAGHLPRYAEEAVVTGVLPQVGKVALKQRKRWEHGHIYTVITQVPRLLLAAMRRRSAGLLAMAIDQCVPPIALLVFIVAALFCSASAAALAGGSVLPLVLAAASASMILAGTVSAWYAFGRGTIAAATLLAIPIYILWKIPLYFAFLVNRQRTWLRTDRDASQAGTGTARAGKDSPR